MRTIAILILAMFSSSKIQAQNTAPVAKPMLNHIALQVTDLAKSSRFYQQVLGLDTIPNPFNDGRHTWLQIPGSGHIHLIVAADATKPVLPLKNSHLCFSMPSTQVFADRLKAAGIAWEDWPGKPFEITLRPDGVRQLYLRDPDGYWIEINDDYSR